MRAADGVQGPDAQDGLRPHRAGGVLVALTRRAALAASALGIIVGSGLAERRAEAFEWPGRLERIVRLFPRLDPREQLVAVEKLRDFPPSQVARHADVFFSSDSGEVLADLARVCADLRVPVALQLEDLLAHPSAEVRAAAAIALGHVGGESSAARLIRRLDDSDPQARQAAAQSLGLVGSHRMVAGPLMRALDDRHRNVVRSAMESLVRRGIRAASSAIVDLALDRASPVRLSAYRALGRLRADAATDVLIAGLGDESAAVRLAAADALGELGSRGAVVALTAALGDTPAVAWAAAESLGKIGDDQAVPALARMLRRGPARPAAARAISALRAAHVLEIIAEGGGDAEAVLEARIALRGPLARLPGKVRQPPVLPDDLLPALRDRDPPVRAVAASVLASRAPTEAVAVLIDSFDVLPLVVRPAVLRALAESGGEAAKPLVMRLLREGSTDEKRAIFAGMAAASAPPASEALRAARGLMADDLIGASARALLARERATPGWVEIRTVDRLGRPAPGVPVAVRLADGREVPGRTDSDGVLRLADVPPGPVSVEVRALP